MNIKDFIKSRYMRIGLLTICAFVVALFIFQAGVIVGFRKASFSFGFGEKFYKTFNGTQDNRFMGMGPKGLIDENGAVGKIVKIILPEIVVSDRSNIEKSITVDDDTKIVKFRDAISAEELKVGDMVIVIGEPFPESGQIDAKLIRVIPSPLPVSSTSTNLTK
jgi:hypothetical protein